MIIVSPNSTKVSGSKSSFLGDGSGDYISASDHTDWDVGTGNFTIEMFIRWNGQGTDQGVWSLFSSSNDRLAIHMDGSSSNKVQVIFRTGGTQNTNITSSGTWSTGTWYHLAVVRNGSTITLYKDGSSQGTSSDSTNYSVGTMTHYIGTRNPGYGFSTHNGWIDEFRFSNTARYTSGFTPTTGEFSSDSNTKVLLHFGGTDASTTFTDSGNTGHSWTASGNAQIDTAQFKF